MMPQVCATVEVGRRRRPATWVAYVGVLWLSAFVFGWGLVSEPRFVDEGAFISQAYFCDLYMRGDRHDPAWLEYPAYDLPPLPKYLIGIALHAGGQPILGRRAAHLWYQNTRTVSETAAMLQVARVPSVILGVVGGLAILALGTIAANRRVGLIAALFLIANPLYRLHASRAMADVPAEALILSTAAVGLWTWRGTLSGRWHPLASLAASVVVGVLGGLAVLAKLNGGLGLMIVGAWTALALGLSEFPWRRRVLLVLGLGVTAVVSFLTFAAGNPFLTARPRGPLPSAFATLSQQTLWGRVRHVLAHRAEVSRGSRSQFPADALTTPAQKLSVVAAQGFGRFGPLGPPRHRSDVPLPRFARRLDTGALIWLPLVLAGLAWAWRLGRRQVRLGEPPTGWALMAQATVALATVTAFIPLAWDRYLLSIQAGSALLAAGALVAGWDAWTRRDRPATPVEA